MNLLLEKKGPFLGKWNRECHSAKCLHYPEKLYESLRALQFLWNILGGKLCESGLSNARPLEEIGFPKDVTWWYAGNQSICWQSRRCFWGKKKRRQYVAKERREAWDGHSPRVGPVLGDQQSVYAFASYLPGDRRRGCSYSIAVAGIPRVTETK